jgi:hypothetical protein
MTQITINLQSVTDGLPPEHPDQDTYSIECMAVVDGLIFDRSVMYHFEQGGWVWADLGMGNTPDDYHDELGGDTPKVTHWAPWPTIPALVPAA